MQQHFAAGKVPVPQEAQVGPGPVGIVPTHCPPPEPLLLVTLHCGLCHSNFPP